MQQKGTRLAVKVAIVSGAGSRTEEVGTGQAMSVLFARQGAKVLLADRVEENALKTLEPIEKEGGEASVFVGDVTVGADCQAMADTAVARYGTVDILINNAGIPIGGTVVTLDEDRWDAIVDVNLKSVMLCSKYAIPKMIEAGGGAIVNISSIDGMRAGWAPNIPYAAAKGGVIAMTSNMAVHHGRDNIRVNCISPGHIHAAITSNIEEKWRNLRRKAGPLGTEGTAWDVAWAALFLASDEARWISGVNLPVDAGTLAATPLAILEYLR